MIDLTNKKFNRLMCIRPIGRTKLGLVIWECRCDCGTVKNIVGSKLKRGYTKSCGCFKNENLKHEGTNHPSWDGYQEISKTFYSRMTSAAQKRGWEWNISIEYLWNLFVQQDRKCAVTGIILVMPIHLRQLSKRNQITASLDRIDPRKGYIDGNVQWVCKRVNYMKHTQTDEMFLAFVKVIYEHNHLDKVPLNSNIFDGSNHSLYSKDSEIK